MRGRREGGTREDGGWGREREREGERPRNLRFHLVTRACPSRFSSSPCGCSLDGGWGPRETRPPAGSRARHPSLPLSRSVSPFRSPPSLPPLRRSRSDGGPPPVPQPLLQPLYNILALCFSSLVILANDYEVRISVGPPGISGNTWLGVFQSPGLEHVTLAERTLGWTGMDSIGRWRGEGSGQRRRSRGGDLFRWLFSDTDWIERRID